MNNQTLVIYEFNILYEILKELENYLNFDLINCKNNEILKINKKEINYLIISKKKLKKFENQIIIDKFPLSIKKLVENININFLKKKYNQQSEIVIGKYKLNLNSRVIYKNNNFLNLTEREANIISFINSSKNPINIDKLQSVVWGHNSKLETHTVETHIYRLRKKVFEKFNDSSFIVSSKLGYTIK